MLSAERRQRIADLVAKNGFVRSLDLRKSFAVSHMTIQRDLAELEHLGLIRRIHGGASAIQSRDIGYGRRERISRREKDVLGQKAATLIQPGQVVFIDAGTSCIEVARHILKQQIKPLNIVTTSVKASAELGGVSHLRITQLGGELYDQSFGVVGESVTRSLKHFKFDWAFLGTSGVDTSAGLTNNNHLEVTLKQAVMKRSIHSVFLADSSKLGRVSLAQICPISEPQTLITTSQLSEQDHRVLLDYGWEVMIADEMKP